MSEELFWQSMRRLREGAPAMSRALSVGHVLEGDEAVAFVQEHAGVDISAGSAQSGQWQVDPALGVPKVGKSYVHGSYYGFQLCIYIPFFGKICL